MHEYRKFIERHMAMRGWRQRDLVEASGLSRQVVSKILRDERELLPRRPDPETVTALAQAFEVSEEAVLAAVGVAMGLPLKMEAAPDISEVPLGVIMAEMGRRARMGAGGDLDSSGMRSYTATTTAEPRQYADMQIELPEHKRRRSLEDHLG